MSPRRVLAILVLAIPLAVFGLVVGASGFADATVGVEAPKYTDLKSAELAKQLDRDQLAKALASATDKAGQMNARWQRAKANYDRLLYVLLSVVAALSAVLAYVLWRMPPSGTPHADARTSASLDQPPSGARAGGREH